MKKLFLVEMSYPDDTPGACAENLKTALACIHEENILFEVTELCEEE